MAQFDLEVVESLLRSLFEGHPDENVSNSSDIRAGALAKFLKNAIDGRVNNVDITTPTTNGYGYINEFSKHNDTYFVKISLITGKTTDGDKSKFRFQYLSLIVDRSLAKFAQNMIDSDNKALKQQICKMQIAGLHHEIETYNEKPLIKSLGVLTEIGFCQWPIEIYQFRPTILTHQRQKNFTCLVSA